MNKFVLMVVLATVSLAAFALETIQLGNLRFTCPNQCVMTRNGDDISISDSQGADITVERVSEDKPTDP